VVVDDRFGVVGGFERRLSERKPDETIKQPLSALRYAAGIISD